MLMDGKIAAGRDNQGNPVVLLPQMANRHGLIAGATGTGKTVTLKVLAESFSDLGVPVFVSDVKGDLAGLACPGADTADLRERVHRFGLQESGFTLRGYPVTFWDLYGENGIPLRTTISEMGPLLLARILGLNDLQSDLLSIAFRIADEQQLLLVDTKDLKALLNYIDEHRKDFQEEYGRISSASLAVIVRAVVALEGEGADQFFGETALNINDWFTTARDGRGMIHILDAQSLVNNGKLYSTFLLWFLSELFETLPEVGDPDRPRMVFFFDEAHLLFRDASRALLEKIEQVVKLIRSKGVGIWFCTQNPSDIPGGVLAQLGNKVEHALHAYTPSEQKAIKAAADSFRPNPEFDTAEALQALGVGEAIISFLDEKGVPDAARKVCIYPPESRMGAVSSEERAGLISGSALSAKYSVSIDPDSAYEFLKRKVSEEAALQQQELERQQAAVQQQKEDKEREKEARREEAARQKQEEKERLAREKEEKKKADSQKKAVQKAAKSVGNSVAGTVGREVGKSVGGSLLGKFGRTLGGNVGASLGRGLMSTLFHR